MNYFKITFLIFIFFSFNIYSESLEASIKVNQTNIYFGEDIELELSVKNADKSVEIDLENLKKDFRVAFISDQSVNESYVRIINGEIYKHEFYGHKFFYRLQAKKSGTFFIGPIKVNYKNQTAVTKEIKIKVEKSAETDICFIEIESPLKNYIKGETFKISLKIYIKRLENEHSEIEPIFPRNPPYINIPWLDGIKGLEGKKAEEFLYKYLIKDGSPGFNINNKTYAQNNIFNFFEEEITKYKLPKKFIEKKSPLGTICSYICYQLDFEYTAKNIGNYIFGPVLLKGLLATRIIKNYNAESKRFVVTGQPIEIKVKEPPLIGRPEIYSGAIGNFKISSKILPTTAYVGSPLTLIIEIEGEGDLDNIKNVNLSKQKEIKELLKFSEDVVSSETKKNVKIFRYDVKAYKPNIKKIPSIKFCYFDVKTQSYKIIKTNPMNVSIKPIKTEFIEENKKIKNIAEKTKKGIFANYKNIDALENVNIWKLWEKIFLLVMPFIYLILFLFNNYKKEIGNDILFKKKKTALKNCIKKIKKTENINLKQFYKNLYFAIMIQIADYLNLNGETLVIKEVKDYLENKNINKEAIKKVIDFLYFCEDVYYSGKEISPEESEKNRLKAIEIAKILENNLRKV